MLFEYLSTIRTVKTVFGELFGGGYPHKDVPKNDSAKIVQRGIYYNPDNDFLAFDILIDHVEYLDIKTTNELFEKFEFVFAKDTF